jgi:hypothetical protein
LDLRPMAGDEHGGCTATDEHAFRIQHATGVAMSGCRVRWVGAVPAWYAGEQEVLPDTPARAAN